MIALRPVAVLAAIGLLVAAVMAAVHSKSGKHDPGVTATSIKIGNIMPYSGPASAYGVIGTAEAAYFRKINDEGGINSRKIDSWADCRNRHKK
jgi:branched-chain amino acid transport system substrate-binding protein